MKEKEEEVGQAILEDITENLGDKSKVRISKVLAKVKDNYEKEKYKDAIGAQSVREDFKEDEFAGEVVYNKPASEINATIVVTVDENFNISSYIEEEEKFVDIPGSEYKKKGNIYCYSPDLSGFKGEATYYVTYDKDENEQIAGRIDKVKEPQEGWYDYENKIWGNVVTVTEDNVTYWTWIPRYKYKENGKVADVYFVDIENKCAYDTEGKVDDTYILPESFTFSDKELKGFWLSKYEIQLSEDQEIEKLRCKAFGTKININVTNPNGTYTIYLNGEKYKEGIDLSEGYQLTNLRVGKIYDICVYSEARKTFIGRKKVLAKQAIKVDYSGFNPQNTYYVVYDEEGNNEQIAGRIDKISEPKNWYNYENKIWANLVTVNEDNVTYWTYIPRYEYCATGTQSTIAQDKKSEVIFIPNTQVEPDEGYIIPESFTFGGKNLAGYWLSKYEIQLTEDQELEKVDLSLEGNNIIVTTTKPEGSYSIYVEGEKVAQNVTLPYTLNNVKNTVECKVCVYSESNSRMVGEKSISTYGLNYIEVDISKFNPECTYYVTYNEAGEEIVGDKINLDKNGNPTNAPENWYDYKNKIWANIVTKGKDKDGNELITYWTYIPRYEYCVTGTLSTIAQVKKSDVRFIPVTKITPDEGYVIPESFTFGGVNLKGIWLTKYEIQDSKQQ